MTLDEVVKGLERRINNLEDADSAHRYTISELIKANEKLSAKIARVREVWRYLRERAVGSYDYGVAANTLDAALADEATP